MPKNALTAHKTFQRKVGMGSTFAVVGLMTLATMVGVRAGDDGKKEVAPPPPQPVSNEESMDDAWWTGPLVAPNPTALPVGTFLAEPYFSGSIGYGSYDRTWGLDRASHNSYSAGTNWLLEYGLLPNFSISVLPGAQFNWTHSGNSSSIQMTDLQVRVQYMFHKFQKGDWLPTISLEVGEIFPTGQYDNLSRAEDGLGRGAYSTRLGLWTQYYYWLPNGRILRQRFDFWADIPTGNVKVHNLSSYGTEDGFRGHASVGNTYNFDLAYEYSLTSHWVPAIDFLYVHGERTTVSGIQRVASGLASFPVRNGGTSSEYFEIDPALEYNFNDRFGIIAGAEIAITGRNAGASVIPQFAINMVF